MDRESVGARVRRLRRAHDLNLEELAARTAPYRREPVSRSYLSRLELDQHESPRVDELRAVAKALGVTVAYLIGEDESAGAALLDELLADPEFAMRLIRRGRIRTAADLPERVRRAILEQIDGLLDLYMGEAAEPEPEPRETGPHALNGHPEPSE